MTSDRDKRRKADPLHKRARTPAPGVPIGPPLYGAVSGELDASDDPDPERFDAATPVEIADEVLKRIRAESALETETQPSGEWEWARRLDTRLAAVEELAEMSASRWRLAFRVGAALLGLAGGAFVYTMHKIRSSGYDQRTHEVYRAQVDRNTEAIVTIREVQAEIRGELRRSYFFRSSIEPNKPADED